MKDAAKKDMTFEKKQMIFYGWTPLNREQQKDITYLYNNFQNMIFKEILKWFPYDHNVCEDVFQEIFLSLCRNIEKLNAKNTRNDLSCMGNLLKKITFHHCLAKAAYLKKKVYPVVALERKGGVDSEELYNVVDANTKGSSTLFENESRQQKSEYAYLEGIIESLSEKDADLMKKFLSKQMKNFNLKTELQDKHNERNSLQKRFDYLIAMLSVSSIEKAHLLDFRHETSPRIVDRSLREVCHTYESESRSLSRSKKSIAYEDWD